MNWRMVIGGLCLQALIAAFMLKAPFLRGIFMALNALVTAMDTATRAGTAFVFGFVGGGPEERLAFPPGRYAQRPFCFRHSAKSSRFFSFVAG